MKLVKAQNLKVNLNHRVFAGLIERPEPSIELSKKPPRKRKRKLPFESEKQVYWLYHYSGKHYTQSELGIMFKVAPNTICGICQMRHIFEPLLFPDRDFSGYE